ncbi:hypothetical protein NUACC21_70320 [Scytonema sp. NUACC21]
MGDALLVCPVVEEGARSRKVTLPKGRWYNFWNDAVIEGSQLVTIDSPLEQIPLLVRAGSILSMEENKQLILHIYPPIEGSSQTVLYSDAGDGYGESRLDKFDMVRSENSLEITRTEEGKYLFPYTSVQLHLHGLKPQQAWIDDIEVACHGQILECQRFQKVSIQKCYEMEAAKH